MGQLLVSNLGQLLVSNRYKVFNNHDVFFENPINNHMVKETL